MLVILHKIKRHIIMMIVLSLYIIYTIVYIQILATSQSYIAYSIVTKMSLIHEPSLKILTHLKL